MIYNYLCNRCLSSLTLWVRLPLRRSTTLCYKVCQWFVTCRWFSPGPPVSSTTITDRHHIAEILWKVALNTINQPNKIPHCRNCSKIHWELSFFAFIFRVLWFLYFERYCSWWWIRNFWPLVCIVDIFLA